MKYASAVLSLLFLAFTGLFAMKLAPDLLRDFKIRGHTMYVAKSYEVWVTDCRSPVPLLTYCELSVRTRQGIRETRNFEYLIFGEQSGKRLLVLQTRRGQITTNLGRTYLMNRIVTFTVSGAAMFFVALGCLVGMHYAPVRPGRRKPGKYNEDQLRHLAARIRVPENPVEVWHNILQGSHMNWVVFNRGSLVLCEDNRYPPEHLAWQALDQLSYTGPGTDQVEPSIYLNHDYAVWIISYPGSSVMNFIRLSDTFDEATAARRARQCSAHDAFEKRILYIERRI